MSVDPLHAPEAPLQSWRDISALLTSDHIGEMREKFGFVGDNDEIALAIGKVLWRFQSAIPLAHEPKAPAQNRELGQLKKSIDRTLKTLDAITSENKSQIDNSIMYRDPFNSKFYFAEQMDYWTKNENSVEVAMNKLKQISHALGE